MAPSVDQIKQMFKPLSEKGKGGEFFDHVADDVKWIVSGHTSMSGLYTNKKEFVDATISVLGDRVLKEPLRVEVARVIGGGQDSEWAAVELRAVDEMQCRNGLKYDMKYCWICRFANDGKIVEVIAYLDTDLLARALAGNT